MWSNSIINKFPTFHAQYAVELLHSLGAVFDTHYLTNENLQNIMHDFAKRDDNCFYQLALHAYRELRMNSSFDLTTIFNDEAFYTMNDSLKEEIENSVSEIYKKQDYEFVFHLGKE
jgi:hypothetical protein